MHLNAFLCNRSIGEQSLGGQRAAIIANKSAQTKTPVTAPEGEGCKVVILLVV